ncbi:MAG TPA: hypothetical protein VHB74_05610 [Devosia sp.]|nr:hypothetical protein [Devosia sp.]
MLGLRSFRLKSAVAPLSIAVMAMVLAPLGAQAAIFASAPKDDAASLSFKTTPGVFTGKWISRSIAISGDAKASFAKLGLGTSEFDLVEQGGKITGTRPGAAKGKTYDVNGVVVYGPRRAPQIVLHSTSVVGGKSYDYDYFGYLMPSWNVSASQPDTFMGTVVRTDPSAPNAPAVVVSFIATREGAAASAKTAAPAK